VDTIETAAPWARLEPLRARVTDAVRQVEGTAVVTVHQSHAYLDGACLYFTVAGRPADDPDAYYDAVWAAATGAILTSGGSLSHHHGVGRNRAGFVREALGAATDVLHAIKAALDPDGICNPGILGLGAAP
jgi:alkyldihydroxyacetonephosphate synthase